MGQTIKVNKHDKGIGEYVERVQEWKNYTGKILNGKMYVCVGGRWLSMKMFNTHYPIPFVLDFMGDPTNPDGTKNYLRK